MGLKLFALIICAINIGVFITKLIIEDRFYSNAWGLICMSIATILVTHNILNN